jgi:hypothetical protein
VDLTLNLNLGLTADLSFLAVVSVVSVVSAYKHWLRRRKRKGR